MGHLHECMTEARDLDEATYIAINVIILHSIVNKYPQDFADISRIFLQLLKWHGMIFLMILAI